MDHGVCGELCGPQRRRGEEIGGRIVGGSDSEGGSEKDVKSIKGK